MHGVAKNTAITNRTAESAYDCGAKQLACGVDVL
jgi:hypothetical protein